MAAAARIQSAFDTHGVSGSLHAMSLDTKDEIAVNADVSMPLASVFKVALAVAVWRAAERQELRLTERIDVDSRSAGPTGLGAMLDRAQLSIRDLAYLALAVSDNGAADVLLDRIGMAAVNDVHRRHGMTHTRTRLACREFASTILEDTGQPNAAAASAVLAAEPELLNRLRVRDPERSNAGPARDQTRLLAALWNNTAASAESCAAIRRLMRLQVWPHRMAAGFPDAGMTLAGKTGTLPGVRNEIGVIEDFSGRRIAIAVLTTSPSPAAAMPHLDALIGTVSRMAYDELIQ